jgi:hypothetical protein
MIDLGIWLSATNGSTPGNPRPTWVASMDRPTFVINRSDRLIARLKHIFYAWRFAARVNGRVIAVWRPVPAFWQKYDGTDYSPIRIFDLPKFYAEGGSDELVFLEGAIPAAKGRSLRDPEFAEMRPRNFDPSYFIDNPDTFYEHHAIGFSFNDEPRSREHMFGEIRELYRRLPHDPTLVRALESSRTRIGQADYVALHVRRGDVDDMLKAELPQLADGTMTPPRLALLMEHYVGRTALDEFYYPHIDAAIQAGQKIVYFSDTPETLNHFAKKFGRNKFTDAQDFKCRFPIQKAFQDFNLLMGAKTIISTGSNYATFAAAIGDTELINVAASGPVEALEQRLYSNFMQGLKLPTAAQTMLREEIGRQRERRLRADKESIP